VLRGPDIVVAAEKTGLTYGHMNVFHRLVDGHPEYDRLDPLTRLGKDEWGVGARVRSIRRPRKPEDIRGRE